MPRRKPKMFAPSPVDPETDPHRLFALAFASSGGSVTGAAKMLGYENLERDGRLMLAHPTTRVWIDRLRLETTKDPAVADITKLQRWWSRVYEGNITDRDGEPPKITDRLRASELLGRSQGAFLERTSVTLDGDLESILKAARMRSARLQRERDRKLGEEPLI